ncbi:hypothetical protein L0664_14920 [Octadecabacter sp. G9-8]|uniref:HPr kinase/phosphorylase C-terminal domain-containing protein n=1 Tax=Octadecabacter dasysiphoniae TaxID=2909341 RepID=A0ABS9CYL9_9RHOB|nr:hypothetical protein [Octadecabacter dasysiphoniae]MCF2872365.1 hypothetical protein [Octadecabacter dasysiphoniae]
MVIAPLRDWIEMQPSPAIPYKYRAYGCNFVSDVPLLMLNKGSDVNLDTITIRRCNELPPRPERARQIGPLAWAGADYLSLDVDRIVRLVAQDAKTLLYQPYDGIDDQSVQLFLMTSGLGAVLMQRGLLVMRGTAVERDGSCVMCIGQSGVGKSTVAAGLMQRGFRVISDDICGINDRGQIIPGGPSVKIWQDAADVLGIATDSLTRLRPHMEKFDVPLGGSFCDETVSVRTIYLLSEHQSGTISCDVLTGHDKFVALRDNTYQLPFMAGMDLGALHFKHVTALSQGIVVKHIKRPMDGFDLDHLIDTLIKDLNQQSARS